MGLCSRKGIGSFLLRSFLVFLSFLVFFLGGGVAMAHSFQPTVSSGMRIESPAFENGQEIPTLYTYQGRDLSPPLSWGGLPPGTRTLVLVMEDPDVPDPAAPQRDWVHWILYNIPASAKGLEEGGTPLPAGTQEGLNDWGRMRYGGPHPPIGRHRYFFRLYALDIELNFKDPPRKKTLEDQMWGHIIGTATLFGTYQLKR